METLLRKLRRAYPELIFSVGDAARWSAREQIVTYSPENTPEATWALLHELGHALLGHTNYESDVALLHKEVAAWEKAKQLALEHKLRIEDEYIQQCLDTYRDWLYRRSTCPNCDHHGLQDKEGRYSCLNCKTTWKVSPARFCRPYRLRNALKAK